VKLIDFGLAKQITFESSRCERETGILSEILEAASIRPIQELPHDILETPV
jgi:hypothetical protein